MPYKDKEAQKKAANERIRRYRERQKGVTQQGVTPAVIPEGVTLYWYTDGVRETLTRVPAGHKVLSDGQVWLPGNNGWHGGRDS